MTAPQTILVPVDFSDASLAALAMARELGAKLGKEVVLLHVYTIPMVSYPGMEPLYLPGFIDDLAAAAKRALDELSASSGGLESILRQGDPATEILEAVEKARPAMVVMGTHGRRGLAHLFIGSVAERIVRLCPVPVLTVQSPKKAHGE